MPIESIDLERDDEETPVERVSNRYGIPKQEVEALIAGKPLVNREPHPLTMGTLMNKKQEIDTTMHNQKQPWSPIAVLGAILGVISILSLIVLLVFIMRSPKRSDQFPVSIGVSASDSVSPVNTPLSDENVTTPIAPVETQKNDEKTATTKPKPHKKQTQPRTYLTTTNSLEAEEKLAELRAEGNRKAKINISSKNGVTTYKVQ